KNRFGDCGEDGSRGIQETAETRSWYYLRRNPVFDELGGFFQANTLCGREGNGVQGAKFGQCFLDSKNGIHTLTIRQLVCLGQQGQYRAACWCNPVCQATVQVG